MESDYRGPTIVEAYLKKLKHAGAISGLISRFNKRYFVLNLITRKFYYMTAKGKSKPEKSYNLEEIIAFDPNPKIEYTCEWKFGFEVSTKERVYMLYSESVSVHRDFCLAFKSILKAPRNPSSDLPNPDRRPEVVRGVETTSEAIESRPPAREPASYSNQPYGHPPAQEVIQQAPRQPETFVKEPAQFTEVINTKSTRPFEENSVQSVFSQREDVNAIRRVKMNTEKLPQAPKIEDKPQQVKNEDFMASIIGGGNLLKESFKGQAGIIDILEDMDGLNLQPVDSRPKANTWKAEHKDVQYAKPVYQPPAQPVYQQPSAQPVYQQPSAQPVYQQPSAQPVYQQPAQPVYQPPPEQPAYSGPPQYKEQPIYTGQPRYQEKPTYKETTPYREQPKEVHWNAQGNNSDWGNEGFIPAQQKPTIYRERPAAMQPKGIDNDWDDWDN